MWMLQIWLVLLFYVTPFSCNEDSQNMPCPAFIMKFQAPIKTQFYECKNEIAILRHCESGTRYIPYEMRCIQTDALPKKRLRRDTSSKTTSFNQPTTIKQQSLGQLVPLGTLYNRKTEEYFIERNLWSPNTVTKSQQKQEKKYSITKFFAGKTSAEKLDKMDISAELKMSFMAGLIEVGGSAHFFRESNVFDNEEVFNMKYHATTHNLYMSTSVPVDNKNYCTQKDVTHVVSSVTYGLNAFFNFRKKVANSLERQEIQGTLQALVKSIPGFSIEGKASLKIEGTRKSVFDQTAVTLNGDFLLGSSPTTFESAIKAYQEITGMLKNDDTSNAQIVEVKLTPITQYCTSADVILVKISQQIMISVTNTLDSLEKTKIKIETFLSTRAAKKFRSVRINLVAFADALKIFQNNMKSKLIKLLPAIKGDAGGASEKDLIALLNEYTASPFNEAKSSLFLENRNREIQALTFLLDHFKSNTDNVFLTDYNLANDVKLLLKNPFVVVFDINILVPTITKSYLDGNLDETLIWFNKDEEIKRVGKLVNLFKEFANSNKNREGFAYLIKVNKRTTSPTIIQANTKIFHIPQQPTKLQLKHRTYNSISFSAISKPSNVWITYFTVSLWKTAEGYENKQDKRINFSKHDIVIDELDAATSYEFLISFETDFGRSPPSDTTDRISTRPSSPPTNLQIKTRMENYVTVTWEGPLFIRAGLNIDQYTVKLLDHTKKAIASVQIEDKEATFRNLKAFHQYSVIITAQVRSRSSNPTVMQVFTAPPTPKPVTIKEINLNTVTIQWLKPDIIPNTEDIEYAVKYTMMDTSGKKTIDGTEKTLTTITQPSVTIQGLAEGTYYAFQTQVITVKGSSIFSMIATAKTKYEKTELDQLKATINDQLIRPHVNKLEKTMNDIQTVAANDRNGLRKDITAVQIKVNKMIEDGVNCKMIYTNYDSNGKEENNKFSIRFLDRHNLQCDVGYALNSFHLQTSGDTYRYVGKCCRVENLPTTSTDERSNDYTRFEVYKFTFLEKQNVECKSKDPIIGFRLSFDGDVMGYHYKCLPQSKPKECVLQHTNYDDAGNGNTKHLDRHTVACSTGGFISQFKLDLKSGHSECRYEYKCCFY